MPDEIREEQTADPTIQPSVMPAENNNVDVVQPTSGHVLTGVSTEAPVQDGLPQDVKERTRKEFEKLQEQLKYERAEKERLQAVFTTLEPKGEPKTTSTNVDETQQRLHELEQKVLATEARVNSDLEQQENNRVYEKYPALNPESDAHDKRFHTETRRIILDSLLNPEDYGGKQLSFEEAADHANEVLTGAVKSLEFETQKEQASHETSGNSGRRSQVTDLSRDSLVRGTRKGDIDAVIQRLRNIPPED